MMLAIALGISLAGGAGLFWSQPPRRHNWLQFPALMALLWAIFSVPSPGAAALCGLHFALAYVTLQLLELRLHAAISALLALSQSALWTLFALGAAHFGRDEAVIGSVLVASLGAFLTWAEWSLLPLWGTAQNFARGWSRAPQLVQGVALTGVSGAVWCLFLLTELLTRIAMEPREWLRPALALGALVLVVSTLNFFGWKRENGAPKLRVAAFGWGEYDGNFNRDLQVARAIRQAAEQGAALLVLPEAAFQIADRAAFRRTFGNLARTHQIALAVGYFDLERNCNCTDFINARGGVEGRYLKTKLVPIFENYTRGNGEMAGIVIGSAQIGALICQDDNFATGAARYGRAATQILAIPTHDWRAVKDFHSVNALWRGLEFRLGIVKAASGGISLIAAPRGEILARCDHTEVGPQLLVAEMPLGSGQPTLYARLGDAFPVICGLAVLGALLLGYRG